MEKKEFEKLRDFIYRKTGIKIDDRKYDILNRKFENLMQKYEFNNFRTFFHELRFKNNSKLMQDVINLITVNETYFYRENYQFEALVKHILPRLDKIRPKNEVIRILNAPCSSGEESYSIALHLLDDNDIVNKRDIEIIGIDIDSNVIERAKKGIFSKRSVQFIPQHLLREYFTEKNGMYEIAPFLKEAITFKRVNVMDKFAMKRLGKFDVIFSRNMLIYFDDESRKQVAMTFYEMLKEKSFIFLGHAESMSRIVSVFKTLKVADSIVYQKA